jgi:hypothetical protein
MLGLPDPTRLIDPGTRTPPRTDTDLDPDGLIDVRTLPLEPVSRDPRCYAITAVGAEIGTEFQARELLGPPPFTALRGRVLLTLAPANPPGPRPGLVSVAVFLAGPHGIEPVAVWPALDASWPEITRTAIVFAARHPTSTTR